MNSGNNTTAELINNHIKTCADCKWTLSILRGKPIIVLYCQTCKRWFRVKRFRHVNNDVVNALCDGDGTYVEAMFYCDCLTKLITVGYIPTCCKCNSSHVTVLVNIHSNNCLHRLIRLILRRISDGSTFMYDNCHFPKNTFVNRCDADKHLLDAYLRAFPIMKEEVRIQRARRKEEQEKHRAMINKK